MLTYYSDQAINNIQADLYQHLCTVSRSYPTTGRLVGVVVVALEGLSEAIRPVAALIENIFMALVNTIGAPFSKPSTTLFIRLPKTYQFKDAIKHLERGIHSAVSIPVTLALCPLKMAYQLVLVLKDPTSVRPF